MLRTVAGTPAVLTWNPIAADGEPVDPGVVTVTVTAADGAAVVTDAATSGTGVAPRTLSLSASQVRTIDRLTVEWSVGGDVFATDVVDVVGGVYFSNNELRERHPAMMSMPVPRITFARQVVESKFEMWTKRGWVPQVAVETVRGVHADRLIVSWPDVRRVRSVQFLDSYGVAVAALDSVQCAAIAPAPDGVLVGPFGQFGGDVRVVYEHGHDAPTPSLRNAAMELCSELLAVGQAGGPPRNAVTMASTDGGWSAVLVTAGVRGNWTSLPDVNQAIIDHEFRKKVVAA